ncbi:MAG: 23S rRNA (adenine(2503)-C(2))-methyltransferase RlmN [Spirochaetes bacterium]|nr:23S rRNA (adenine(2503)-C(2))-methyltransferase RlmN [Spirochaetota bacterium]
MAGGNEPREALCGIPLDELCARLAPLPRFRAAQIFKWIARGVFDIRQMTDIPAALREELEQKFEVLAGKEEERTQCKDSLKALYSLPDGVKIEAVLLWDGKGRVTACLSTQAGCPLGCVFCKTGSGGLIRDLTSGEIVEQFLRLRSAAWEAGGTGGRGIDNIVFMGMGEPLLNLPQLRRAIGIITDPQGINFSKRRITLSTSGISAGLVDLADSGPPVRLALSLVSADEDLRQRLMPAFKGSLAQIKDALVYFQERGGGRVTLEIVLLGGINTGKKDAGLIARFAKGLDSVVNLIPWNPVAGLTFEGHPLRKAGEQEIERFAGHLEELNLKVTKRISKGRGIMSACGQLAAGKE